MLKFGIMGAGRIAHSFCGAARLTDMAEVAAVASKDIKRAEKFAAEENIPKAYGSYAEMLSDPEIDVVYIATTHNFHYDNIMQCFEAGKPVLCEKALVETEEKTRAVINAAKEKGLFLMEAMWSRFLPKSLKVREWVSCGRIGEVKLIQGTIGNVCPKDDSDRFYNAALGGGVTLDRGVYLIDLLPYFACQKITEIQAWTETAPTGIDSQLNINMKLETAIANGQATFEAVMPEDVYIYGSKGMIKVPKMHWGHEAILYDEQQNEVEHFSCPCDYGFVYEIEETVRCIEAGKLESDIASHEMSIENGRLYDLILGSK